jgi:hypothetical protein
MRALILTACITLAGCNADGSFGHPYSAWNEWHHTGGFADKGCTNVVDGQTGRPVPYHQQPGGPPAGSCPPKITGTMSYAEVRKLYAGSGWAAPESCPYAQGSATCQQWESDKATINNRELATEYHKANQNHVCNSYNPSGCLPQAQKDAIAAQAQQNRDAITCYYGDQGACQRHPGGAAGATAQSQQMLWDSCLSSYRGMGSDYYGTAHLACNFVH